MDPALAFAAAFSHAHDLRLSFFQLVLRSIARVLDEFPRLSLPPTETSSFYCARALARMKDLLERPEQLV